MYWSGCRQHDVDGGSCSGAAKLKMSAQLADALAHARDSDSGSACRALEPAKMFRGNAPAVVGDFELDDMVITAESNGRGGRPGVAVHIGETLLQDPKEH